MGIKNFKIFINKFSSKSINKLDLSKLSNKIIAIDISIYLYKYKYYTKNNSKQLVVSFLKQIVHLKKYNITPIYIFDGKPPPEKSHVINERKNNKRNKYEKIELLKKEIDNINSSEENNKIYIEEIKKKINKIDMSIISVTRDDILLIKDLFDKIGVQYYQADTEAEIICARLVKNNIVHGVFSNDTDVLPNNGKFLYTNYDHNRNYVTEINLDNLLSDINITMEQFIDMCILCGCDYTIKINAIGSINAFKLIKKYKSIENIIENIKDNAKYKINEEFLSNFNYKKARLIFNEDHNIIINDKKELNKKELILFMKKNQIKFDIRLL